MTKKELFDFLEIKPSTIRKIGKCSIVNEKYIYKENKRRADYYEYLLTRNFNYFPNIYSKVDDEIELMDYIISKDVPTAQKIEDLAYITSILHLCTTFDKLIDLDSIKEIYETTTDKLDQLYNYFYDLQNQIEEELYMSPANYLLIRNMSLIYQSIALSKEYIDKWYELVKDTRNIRYSYIHGNLNTSHLLEGDKLYLISWDKSRIDLPIYDLITLYQNSYLDISLSSILKIYENKYPLKKEEKFLLFSKLLIPRKIGEYQLEFLKTKDVSDLIIYLEGLYNYLKNDSKKTNNNTNK